MGILDPLTSLAFSVYTNPGAFVFLLGSGVSRSASIPTGWDVVVDLVNKIANNLGEKPDPSPEDWFYTKFGVHPNYSTLLQELTKTSTTRKELLRPYFEPTETERQEGKKLPQVAHKAIAELVRHGFIKVIITTNFDRLIENALADVGIVPQVLDNVDSLQGATPLPHINCTIIKLHGDYLDSRIRNLSSELETYDEATNLLMDQVFDDYGILVCGWSAEWDQALRACFERRRSRRYPLYWTFRGRLSDKAIKLLADNSGEKIPIKDADSFFKELCERVLSLKNLDAKTHPLSPALAREETKQLISKSDKIGLHDMVVRETEELFSRLTMDEFPINVPLSQEILLSRLGKYNDRTSVLLQIISTLGYWSGIENASLISRVISRIGGIDQHFEGTFYDATRDLRKFPCQLLTYAFGISCLANRNYQLLPRVLLATKIREREFQDETPLILGIYSIAVLHHQAAKMIPGKENRRTPTSEHLSETLRDPLKSFIPNENDYELFFDQFECLISFLYLDLRNQGVVDFEKIETWAPIGNFGWKSKYDIVGDFIKQFELNQENWWPLNAGFFDGSAERFKALSRAYLRSYSTTRRHWSF